MTTTTNLGLKKPSGSDKVLIGDLNANADKLDGVIGDPSKLGTTEKGSLVGAINEARQQGATYASQAAASATAAGSSASEAAASKTAAASSATAAEAAKTDAEAAEDAAATAKTEAQSAADSAADSAATATDAKTAAETAKAAAEAAKEDAEAARDEAVAVAGGEYVSYGAAQTLTTAQQEQAQKNMGVTWLGTGAGAHNSAYRGKPLGAAVTDAQWAAIKAGTFEDLYIGDYWTISGVNYRIAAFDYYYQTGDTACTTHHVTIVPDTNMYTHAMNDSNVTTGAYIGSKMYASGLSSAKTTINNAFGASHILNHRQYLQNATTNGYASAGSWYDSTVELMTEQNVYGCKVFGNCTNGTAYPSSYTVDKSQYPLFAHRPDMISNRQSFWLRDVASAAYFCLVSRGGLADSTDASNAYGVRPAFSIC